GGGAAAVAARGDHRVPAVHLCVGRSESADPARAGGQPGGDDRGLGQERARGRGAARGAEGLPAVADRVGNVNGLFVVADALMALARHGAGRDDGGKHMSKFLMAAVLMVGGAVAQAETKKVVFDSGGT